MKPPVVLQDVDGYCSSKRVVFFVVSAFIIASWFANVCFGIIVDANIINALLAIGGVSGVGIAAERFGKKWT